MGCPDDSAQETSESSGDEEPVPELVEDELFPFIDWSARVLEELHRRHMRLLRGVQADGHRCMWVPRSSQRNSWDWIHEMARLMGDAQHREFTNEPAERSNRRVD